MGETVIQCHGLQLQQEEAEETDEHHKIFVEQVEDEYYVQIHVFSWSLGAKEGISN